MNRSLQRLLLSFVPVLMSALAACGSDSDYVAPRNDGTGTQADFLEFINRDFTNGSEPDDWDDIWDCSLSTDSGRTRGVPFRFFENKQLIVGYGDYQVTGSWETRPTNNPASIILLIVMELDRPASRLFGTNSQSISFNLIQAGENFFSSSVGVRPDLIPEGGIDIVISCRRYTADQIPGEIPEILNWQPQPVTYLSTGQLNATFIPNENNDPVDEETTSEPPTTSTPDAPPVTSTPSPTVPVVENTPTANAPLTDITRQVKDIWYTGDFVDTVDGVRQLYGSVIEFNNGEVSRDGETISNEGIAASKRKNPEDWGEGRVSASGLLSYKWRNSRSWYEPYLSAPTRAYPRNQKIRGCFANSFGVEGSGSTPRIYRLCFSANGDFTANDSANNTGTYLFGGHAIRLDFSNGEREEFLFGAHYFDGFIYRLIIADSVYHVTQ